MKELTLSEILEPNNMFELCKTTTGKAKVKQAVDVARITLGVHEMFGYMHEELGVFNRNLSPEEQQNICNIMLWAMLTAKHEQVLAFINGIPMPPDNDEEFIGSC